jgi:hypothetical protein
VTAILTDPAEAARFLNRYARRFSAGAFATPTAKELATRPDHVIGGPGWVAVTRHLMRDAHLADWTGRRYTLPAGSTVVSHLAVAEGTPPPDLSAWDWIYAHPEDTAVAAALAAAGRETAATRVTAASELLALYGRRGTGWRERPEDTATLTALPLTTDPRERHDVISELPKAHAWTDDYPFYSDGSWGQVSLRGFWPDDPARGVKPAEMDRKWKAAHPADLSRRCDWTILAERMPVTRRLIERVTDGLGELERVRLLRMEARPGAAGHLARHTDITDKAAGTRDGQIIRLHMPVLTHPAATMSAWNLAGQHTEAHLPPWTLWYLDARKPHAVTNASGIDRIHLTIDLAATAEARALIASGQDLAAVRP